MSDNRVFKQKVNLSAIGISRRKKKFHYSQNLYDSFFELLNYTYNLLSDLYILTSSSQTTFAKPFNSLTRYGMILSEC